MFAETATSQWMIETSKDCEITDIDTAIAVISSWADLIKSNAKYHNISSKCFVGKKYFIESWSECGTIKKLKEELSWLMENDYIVTRVWATAGNQVKISVNKKHFM